MKAPPHRFAALCHEVGIVSDALHEALMEVVRPKTPHAKDKSLMRILSSNVSAQTFKDLALYELPNPFKKETYEAGDAGDKFGQTVHLQSREIRGILQANRPALHALRTAVGGVDEELAAGFDQLPDAADDPDGARAYAALCERKILTPEILQRIVEAKQHAFFEANRLALIRRTFSLNGILSADVFDAVLRQAIKKGKFFSQALKDRKGKGLDEKQLQQKLSEPLNMPAVDLRQVDVAPELAGLFPEDCVRRNLFLAFARDDGAIEIAVSDPLNLALADALSVLTGRTIGVHFAPQEIIVDRINRLYRADGEEADGRAEARAAAGGGGLLEPEVEVQEVETIIDTMSTVQLVTTIVECALDANATDIHLEPQADGLRVRFRIDGALHRAMDVPAEMMLPVLSRIKVLANLDVTERRRPQDGHFALTVNDEKFDFRISTLPTNLGEKIVIRALRQESLTSGLEKLGLEKKQEAALRGLIERRYGCIMTTGPTGSGKTTTLYTALSLLNSEDRNIVTIEDPVEYQLAGVSQVGVDLKTNLTFANGLRSILRQDPDIIMLGEIRDAETAQVAVRAALTGHLVFTTMHTNTSAGAMVTLMNMGVPHFLVSSAVIGIIAQRLVRRICPDCKKPRAPTKSLLADLGLRPSARPKMFAGEGCANCWESGYKGRAGVYEVLRVDREIRELVDEELAEATLLKQAVKAGMMTLQEAGISKMRQGVTSAEEILKTVFMND